MKLICIALAAALLNARSAETNTNTITFTTLNGNGITWSNATLVKVEANRIMVTEGTRGARVHYTNLPDEVLAVLGFNLDVAARCGCGREHPLRAYSWRRVYEMLTAPYTKAFTSTSIALTDQEMLQANEWARDYIARRKLIPRTARSDD